MPSATRVAVTSGRPPSRLRSPRSARAGASWSRPPCTSSPTQGLRGLTHRAVDRRAGLPEGSCSAYLRTRRALQGALTEHVAGDPRRRRRPADRGPAVLPARRRPRRRADRSAVPPLARRARAAAGPASSCRWRRRATPSSPCSSRPGGPGCVAAVAGLMAPAAARRATCRRRGAGGVVRRHPVRRAAQAGRRAARRSSSGPSTC